MFIVFIYISTSLIFASKADALNITTPDDIFTKKDQEIKFSCGTANGAKVEFCAFTSPNGTNPIENHHFVNNSVEVDVPPTRFEFLQNDFECTMKITNVKESDEGEWTCSIGMKWESIQMQNEKIQNEEYILNIPAPFSAEFKKKTKNNFFSLPNCHMSPGNL